MTREEAIKLIKALKNGLHETGKDFPYRDEIIPFVKVALDMAIKALEQEPCDVSKLTQKAYEDGKKDGYVQARAEQEPCDDAVSRKVLLKIYEDRFLELQKMKHLKDNKGAEDRQMGVNYCINILKEMPPVTPQPKMGWWIEHFDESGKWYECDQCHTDWGGPVNYCPNCGAKMEGDKR